MGTFKRNLKLQYISVLRKRNFAHKNKDAIYKHFTYLETNLATHHICEGIYANIIFEEELGVIRVDSVFRKKIM